MRHAVSGVVLVAAIGCQTPSPDLSETEQLSVLISPATRDFSTVQVGQTSGLLTINVNPAGGENYDTIDSITENCNDFDVDAPGLPTDVYRTCDTTCAVEQCPLQLVCPTLDFVNYQFATVFHPSVAGPQSCVVTITLDGGALIRTAMLTGTGTAPPIDIDVQPGSIPFGDVRIGTPSTAANVAVRNLGAGGLNVFDVTVTGGYSLGGPTAFGVAPGNAQGLTVTCTPGGVGPTDGSMTISSDDPITPTVTVPLQCAGVDSNLAISPSPAVIATTRVGEPLTQDIAIGNSGGASTTLESVSLAGPGMTIVNMPNPGTVLNPGDSANVTVAFDAVAHGDTSATLAIVTSEGTRTAQVSATALLASMALTPDGSADFGPVCAGKTATRTFTVLATADGNFDLTSITEPIAPFVVTPPGLPAKVHASGTNQITFEVTASPETVGLATSQMTIGTDIPNSAPRVVDLSVQGLAAGISATPAELDLGSHAVDVTTIAEPVMLTNCDTEAVEFSNPRIEGVDAGDFAIVVQPPSTLIPANGSVSWLVVLSPHSVGLKEATFAVDHPGGTSFVALLGEGLGDLGPHGGDDGTTSYYSCSAGGSGGTVVWPIALVVVVVMRRRRRLDRP